MVFQTTVQRGRSNDLGSRFGTADISQRLAPNCDQALTIGATNNIFTRPSVLKPSLASHATLVSTGWSSPGGIAPKSSSAGQSTKLLLLGDRDAVCVV